MFYMDLVPVVKLGIPAKGPADATAPAGNRPGCCPPAESVGCGDGELFGGLPKTAFRPSIE